MIQTFPRSVVVWDFETTGLSPYDNEIVEVAVAIVRDGLVVDQWSSLVQFEGEMHEKAFETHGITKEMCEKEGKPLVQVLKRLLQNIHDAEAHVTHNGSRFDLLFLQEGIKKNPVEMGAAAILDKWIDIVRKHIDTAALYKADKMGEKKSWNDEWQYFFARVLDARVPGLKYNVGACCDDLGISREGVVQHRALGDVLLTAEIYKRLTE